MIISNPGESDDLINSNQEKTVDLINLNSEKSNEVTDLVQEISHDLISLNQENTSEKVKNEKDEPEKDEPVKEEPEKAKLEKDEPEKDEPVNEEPEKPKPGKAESEKAEPEMAFTVATLKVDDSDVDGIQNIQNEPEKSGSLSTPAVVIIVGKSEPKPETSRKVLRKRFVRMKWDMISVATKVKLMAKNILKAEKEDSGKSETKSELSEPKSELSEPKSELSEPKSEMSEAKSPGPELKDQKADTDVRPRYNPRFEEKTDLNLLEKSILNLVDFMF